MARVGTASVESTDLHRLPVRRELEAVSSCPGCGSNALVELGPVEVAPQHHACAIGLLEPGDRLAYVLCQACGLVFLNPRYSKATLDRYYRETCPANEAITFPADRDENLRYERRERDRFERLARLARRHAASTATVADLGALDGASLVPFLREGSECFAIDPGFDARRPATAGIQGVPSLEAFGSPGRQADLLLSTQTFEHLADPGAVIRDCAGALRPRGVLVLELPFDLLTAAILEPLPEVGHPEHINFFAPLSLRRLAGVARLVVVDVIVGAQRHKYGGLIPSVTLVARRDSERRGSDAGTPVTRGDLQREVAAARSRVRLAQRRLQLSGLVHRLGRW